MKATFEIGGGYTLIVGGQRQETVDGACSSPVDLSKFVPIQILHHPMSTVTKTCRGCKTAWGIAANTPEYCPTCQMGNPEIAIVQPPDESVFWAALESSHARAIASAILSCATQARQ